MLSGEGGPDHPTPGITDEVRLVDAKPIHQVHDAARAIGEAEHRAERLAAAVPRGVDEHQAVVCTEAGGLASQSPVINRLGDINTAGPVPRADLNADLAEDGVDKPRNQRRHFASMFIDKPRRRRGAKLAVPAADNGRCRESACIPYGDTGPVPNTDVHPDLRQIPPHRPDN